MSGLLYQRERVLLCLRKNTRHFADHWSLPVGHLETGETNVSALKRELNEELGVCLLECRELITLFNQQRTIEQRIFMVDRWGGEIENKEPHLCHTFDWFSPELLPAPITPYTQVGIQHFKLKLMR